MKPELSKEALAAAKTWLSDSGAFSDPTIRRLASIIDAKCHLRELRAVVEASIPACGRLAERLALDMDAQVKDHAAWYRAVKRLRKALAALDAVDKP